jgi:hypothetical protein
MVQRTGEGLLWLRIFGPFMEQTVDAANGFNSLREVTNSGGEKRGGWYDLMLKLNAVHQISSFLQPKLTLSKKYQPVSDIRTYGLRYQFTSHGRLRMYRSIRERSGLILCLPFASIKLTYRAPEGAKHNHQNTSS